MTYERELCKLRILLELLENKAENKGVMDLSRTLNIRKQRISKLLIELEEEGLVDRSELKNPILTTEGRKKALLYSNRIHTSINYLEQEGVDYQTSREEAYHWAMFNSPKSMEVIRKKEMLNRIKKELDQSASVPAENLCNKLDEGVYPVNYMVYRQNVTVGDALIPANEGFENPCNLYIKGGMGKLHIKFTELVHQNKDTNVRKEGNIKTFSYLSNGRFTEAEKRGEGIILPMDAVRIQVVGDKNSRTIYGSIVARIRTTLDLPSMKEYYVVIHLTM